jgi:hypothetical protein
MEFNEYHSYSPPVYLVRRKKYGFFKFLFDCFMVALTSGFWLIWIFIREMRKR